MKKLNFMGIGPIVGGVVLPWLAAAIVLSLKFRDPFHILEDGKRILFFCGVYLVMTGGIMYLLTIPGLLKGLKETKLVKTGTFYLCRNPLYSSIIVLIIPGISLMMNSWLVLTTSIIGLILCKIFIRSEYAEMEMFFGEEYRRYMESTPEFLPFPFRKWFRG